MEKNNINKKTKEQFNAVDNAVETVLKSEDKFKSLFEAIDDGILYVDTKGKVIEANKKIEEFSGFSVDEIVGMNFTKLKAVNIKDVPRLLKIFAEVLITGKTLKNFDVTITKKDGNKIFTEVSTGLVRKEGKIIGIAVVIRDITKRKKTEDELKIKNEELEKFNKIAVGREVKMIELKDKIKELEGKLEKK